jgi:hypothetical protein
MPSKSGATPKANGVDIRQVTIKVNKGKLESMTVRGLQEGRIFAAQFPGLTLGQVAPLVAHANAQDARNE